MKLDTTNRCLVTARHGQVVIGNPHHSLTPRMAVELAAWLVVMADACLRPMEERMEIGGEKTDPFRDVIDTPRAIQEGDWP